MKTNIYLIDLYDLYKSLLTSKEQNDFEDYYFNDLSLQEIALNNQISRNAIFKRLKNINDKLADYESKLKLYKKKNKINDLVKDESLLEKINEIL
ncbi:MAG TPA: DNA-binding protein [Bacilli bacterium]|nr:DNA-binding protein [Bacilli bacterium]